VPWNCIFFPFLKDEPTYVAVSLPNFMYWVINREGDIPNGGPDYYIVTGRPIAK
jgi:hypothetical protein